MIMYMIYKDSKGKVEEKLEEGAKFCEEDDQTLSIVKTQSETKEINMAETNHYKIHE